MHMHMCACMCVVGAAEGCGGMGCAHVLLTLCTLVIPYPLCKKTADLSRSTPSLQAARSGARRPRHPMEVRKDAAMYYRQCSGDVDAATELFVRQHPYQVANPKLFVQLWGEKFAADGNVCDRHRTGRRHHYTKQEARKLGDVLAEMYCFVKRNGHREWRHIRTISEARQISEEFQISEDALRLRQLCAEIVENNGGYARSHW
jgi:hypothetical protein